MTLEKCVFRGVWFVFVDFSPNTSLVSCTIIDLMLQHQFFLFFLFLLLLSSECEVSQTLRTRFSSVCGLMSLAVVGGTRHVSEDVVCSCVASDR